MSKSSAPEQTDEHCVPGPGADYGFAVAVERGFEGVEANADEWRGLCSESFSEEPVFRPEWISTFYRSFAATKELLVLTARLDGRLRAVLPLLRVVERHRGIPARQLRAAANVHTSRFDLVSAPGEEGTAAARALWRLAAGLPGWDVMILHSVPEGGATEALVSAAREDGFRVSRCPCMNVAYLAIDDRARCSDFGDTLPLRSHFRSNFRRRLRQARQKYSVSIEHITRADPAALQRFFELEAAGWKGKAGSAILCSPATRKFYQELALLAERSGYFDLYFLNFNGQPVAGHFGVTCGKVHHALKIAHDENWKLFAPGHMLLGALLQDLARRNVTTLDFIGPIVRWEKEWTQQVRPHYTHYIYRNNPIGFALYEIESRLVPLLRKLRSSDPLDEGR